MYFQVDYRSKAEAKRALASGVQVRIFTLSSFESTPTNGEFSVEGPHYPKPHTFYATVTVVNGLVTKIK